MSEQKQERREWWLDGFGVFDENRIPVNAGKRVHVREVLPGDDDLRAEVERLQSDLRVHQELYRETCCDKHKAEQRRDELLAQRDMAHKYIKEIDEALGERNNTIRELREQLDRYRPIHGSKRLPTEEDAVRGNVLVRTGDEKSWVIWHYTSVLDHHVWQHLPDPIDNTPPPSEPGDVPETDFGNMEQIVGNTDSDHEPPSEPTHEILPGVEITDSSGSPTSGEWRAESESGSMLVTNQIKGSKDAATSIGYVDGPQLYVSHPTAQPPSEPGYRLLEVGEAIQEGDEFYNHTLEMWQKSTLSKYGDMLNCRTSPGVYRRPLSSTSPELPKQKSEEPCKHIWNAHGQCQWCKCSRQDDEVVRLRARVAELEVALSQNNESRKRLSSQLADKVLDFNDEHRQRCEAETRVAELEVMLEQATQYELHEVEASIGDEIQEYGRQISLYGECKTLAKLRDAEAANYESTLKRVRRLKQIADELERITWAWKNEVD